MRTRSSELAASANVLPRGPPQSSHDPFPIPLWQIRQSRSRSSPRDRSARLDLSEHRHRGRNRAARVRGTRQRSRSVSLAEPKMEGTNSRTGRPGLETQTPATDRILGSLFLTLASPDTKDRTSRNQFPVAASALQLLPEQPSLDQSCSRARLIQLSGPHDRHWNGWCTRGQRFCASLLATKA